MLHVLGDIASSPAGQKASGVAFALYQIVMKQSEDSVFAKICKDGSSGVSIQVALVATFLNLSVEDVLSLPRFSVAASGASQEHDPSLHNQTPPAASTDSNTVDQYTREELIAFVGELKAKQDEHEREIRKLQTKHADSSAQPPEVDIDAGGGKMLAMISKPDDKYEQAAEQLWSEVEALKEGFCKLALENEGLKEQLNTVQQTQEEPLTKQNKLGKRKK